MSGQSQGAFAKIAFGSTAFCFARFEDRTVYELADASEDNMCGKLDRDKEDVDIGIVTPRIHFLLQPSPEEIDVLLPLIGYSESIDTFTPIDDFSSIDIDATLYRIASNDLYQNGMVDKFIVRGQKGAKPVSFEMQVVFASQPQIDAAGTFSYDGVSDKTAPWWIHRATLTANSTTTAFQSFVHVTDHHLSVQHNNSTYPTSLSPSQRTIHFGVDTPYTSSEIGLVTAFTGEADASNVRSATGYSASLAFVRGNQGFTLNYHNLKAAITPPSCLSKEEIRNKLFFQAYGTGSTKPHTIVNDPTA